MYCHCQCEKVVGKSAEMTWKKQPKLTVVNSEGICIYCNHYAMKNIMLNENRAINNQVSHEEKPRELLDLWRERSYGKVNLEVS